MPTRCACKHTDAYDCWAARYNLPFDITAEEIQFDGGPCECACHDDYQEDDHDYR